MVYPVRAGAPDAEVDRGARRELTGTPPNWCLMGPTAWVTWAEGLMPPYRVLHRVPYEFLYRPAGVLDEPPGPGLARPARPSDAWGLFPLHAAYEKEEVLFDPAEFQPLASRLHFSATLRDQLVSALWVDGRPVAKAGTNALTANWAQVGGVYTKPEWRGQGLQKRLMAHLLRRLFDQGRGACLFVKRSNPTAQGLYRSLGFASLGEFTITYGERQPGAATLR